MTPPAEPTIPASAPTPATSAPISSAPTPAGSGTIQDEGRFLNYVGHQIPWPVRLIWILFWSFSAWYVIRWLLPALNSELLSPP